MLKITPINSFLFTFRTNLLYLYIVSKKRRDISEWFKGVDLRLQTEM